MQPENKEKTEQMHSMKNLVLPVLLLLFFLAVFRNISGEDKPNNSNPIDRNAEKKFNSILSSIEGTWKCDSASYPEKRTTCYPGFIYKLVFLRNFVVHVYQNDNLIQTSNWKVDKHEGDIVLITNPSVCYASGNVFLTRNQLKLNNTGNQGGLYYFSRK
jgi:hypothetical protein